MDDSSDGSEDCHTSSTCNPGQTIHDPTPSDESVASGCGNPEATVTHKAEQIAEDLTPTSAGDMTSGRENLEDILDNQHLNV